MNNKMKILGGSIAITLLVSFANSGSAKGGFNVLQTATANEAVSPAIKIHLNVKTYQNSSTINGWGYDIYADGALYIHQPYIPAVPGNRGFRSARQAEKAGNFAVYKIRNNIMPPTISIAELDSLGVLH